ncbi:hypothetical protein LI012_13575, partial [Caldibacillus thermoamylovorans]|uniref:hypothetical protein n=1 Tax=Caldibacillus thermoamylovorans TaxID=35841 RepID=UPI001D09400F
SRKQICSHCGEVGPQDVVMPALQQDVAAFSRPVCTSLCGRPALFLLGKLFYLGFIFVFFDFLKKSLRSFLDFS